MSFKFLFKQIIIITESEILRETAPQIWGCYCEAPVAKQLVFAGGWKRSCWPTDLSCQIFWCLAINTLVCEAHGLKNNPLFYRKPMQLLQDITDAVPLISAHDNPCSSVLHSLKLLNSR